MDRQMPPRGLGHRRGGLGAAMSAAIATLAAWAALGSLASRGEAWLLAARPNVQNLAGCRQGRSSLVSRGASRKEEAQKIGQYAASLLRSANGNQADVTKAIQMFHEAADAGDPEARNAVGCMYMQGLHGVPKDVDQGMKVLAQAVDEGSAKAAFNLAMIKYSGDHGTGVDKYAAAKYFKVGADLGNEQCMSQLARMLMHGDGIPKDLTLGAQWYAKGAQSDGRFAELLKQIEDGTVDPKIAKEIDKKMQELVDANPDLTNQS